MLFLTKNTHHCKKMTILCTASKNIYYFCQSIHFLPMNIQRQISLMLTALPRMAHRHGFGVQSPSDYELVRDVLFESAHYYAYKEQGLTSHLDRQLYRIRNHYKNHDIVIIKETGAEAQQHFHHAMSHATPSTVIIIEHTHNQNASLWHSAASDSRTVLTFDMGQRGLILFTPKRIKQNYIL